MRLKPSEITAIKAAAVEAFGPDVVVRLFGSRVDDGKRGGDIDLHVTLADPDKGAERRGRFVEQLVRTVGDREYDVIVSHPGAPHATIDERALAEGIVL